jgi:starch phosphorylase
LSAHLDHNRFVGRTRVAYFSMEIAISPEMPTYSGGLGILAGDTARAAADLDLPIVFVTLISRAGYLRQELDAVGHQGDVPDPWDPQLWAHPLLAMVALPIAERAVWVRPWLYVLQCTTGGAVPILLLDTGVSENGQDDRSITSRLYSGDATLRLKQEIVLGIRWRNAVTGARFRDRYLSPQ